MTEKYEQEEIIRCPAHSGITERLNALENSDSKQWEIINRIQNRPPVWMTFAFSACTGIIGALISYICSKT